MASYLQPGKHVHLIGIGGVSMCALGMVLHGMGIQVTGSDMHQSKATDHLESTMKTPKLPLPLRGISPCLSVLSPGAIL